MYFTKARNLSKFYFFFKYSHCKEKNLFGVNFFVINVELFKKSSGRYIKHVRKWVYYIALFISVNNSEKLIIINP